jgi:hypothetical protein
MSEYIQFTREDTSHAALGVVPAFCLIATGNLTVGVAFAIGLLPTSLMGIAPRRKLRIVYGVVGCLFGVGIVLGALIINANDIFERRFYSLASALRHRSWLPSGRSALCSSAS